MSPCRSSAANSPCAIYEAMDTAPIASKNSLRSNIFGMLKIILLSGVELFDLRPEVFERPSAANLHRRGQLAVFDAQLAVEDPVLPNLLERCELLVNALNNLAQLFSHRLGRSQLARRPPLERLHAF